MTDRSKTETFVGFAIKARALVTGTNAVNSLKRAYLILICDSASQNTKKTAAEFSVRFGCPLLKTGKPLEELTGKENCKVAAVTDMNLAKAITGTDENLLIGPGGKGL